MQSKLEQALQWSQTEWVQQTLSKQQDHDYLKQILQLKDALNMQHKEVGRLKAEKVKMQKELLILSNKYTTQLEKGNLQATLEKCQNDLLKAA